MELTFEAGAWWSYVLVFVAAATPVVEVLVVIPAAILAGMPPIVSTVLALTGNLSTVVLVVLAGDKLLAWWRARRRAPRDGPSPRALRARRLAQRWGVPGLALLAPISTGTHIAALAAVATGAGRDRVLGWMTAGLVLWAVIAALATAFGVQLLG